MTSYDVTMKSWLLNSGHLGSAILDFWILIWTNKGTLIWAKKIKVSERKAIFPHFKIEFSIFWQKRPVRNWFLPRAEVDMATCDWKFLFVAQSENALFVRTFVINNVNHGNYEMTWQTVNATLRITAFFKIWNTILISLRVFNTGTLLWKYVKA